jgi:hypothetical protein
MEHHRETPRKRYLEYSSILFWLPTRSIFIQPAKTIPMSSVFGNPHHAICRSRRATYALDRRTPKDKPRHSLSVVGMGTTAHGTAGVRSVGREYYTIDVCWLLMGFGAFVEVSESAQARDRTDRLPQICLMTCDPAVNSCESRSAPTDAR